MGELIIGVLSGLASAATVLSFLWGFIAQLKRDLKQLETEKIDKLSTRIEDHIKEDRSQEILTKLENLTTAVNRLTDSTNRAVETNAGQTARIEAHDIYLNNLKSLLEQHINSKH